MNSIDIFIFLFDRSFWFFYSTHVLCFPDGTWFLLIEQRRIFLCKLFCLFIPAKHNHPIFYISTKHHCRKNEVVFKVIFSKWAGYVILEIYYILFTYLQLLNIYFQCKNGMSINVHFQKFHGFQNEKRILWKGSFLDIFTNVHNFMSVFSHLKLGTFFYK